jgi:nucleotide-binding universal stress UspA family protein
MKVIIGYDGSTHADNAIDDLQWAGMPSKVDAIVLSAVEWPTIEAIRSWGMVETDFSPEWIRRMNKAEEVAQAGCHRLQRMFPEWNIEMEFSAENPALAILERAKSNLADLADLIVVGTHGRSAVGRALLGSVSMKVVREAPCAVRVARVSRHNNPLRLIIGVDGSAESEAAVSEMCRRFWPIGTESRIVAVHEVMVPVHAARVAIGDGICDRIHEEQLIHLKSAIDHATERLHEAGVLTTPVIEQGDPRDVLLNQARVWNADSVFVGSRGMGRVEGMLIGTVSEATVAHAPCTVEVVHRR